MKTRDQLRILCCGGKWNPSCTVSPEIPKIPGLSQGFRPGLGHFGAGNWGMGLVLSVWLLGTGEIIDWENSIDWGNHWLEKSLIWKFHWLGKSLNGKIIDWGNSIKWENHWLGKSIHWGNPLIGKIVDWWNSYIKEITEWENPLVGKIHWLKKFH